MTILFHKDLRPEHWFKYSLYGQLAHVGSEVSRTIYWKKQNNMEYSLTSFQRALELLTLTIIDPKNISRGSLKELCRVREALIDHFMFDNEYNTTDEQWYNYFFDFGYAAALERGR